MLVSLQIENFAIIDQVTIDFQDQMTVLSGETGAGKSIIIDALSIICGGRASGDFIREGADRFNLKAMFSLDDQSKLRDQLHQIGITIEEDEEYLLIQREFQASGKNTIMLNGQLANVSMLKGIGKYLVDIHGQNDHQDLLDSSKHLDLLDHYAMSNLAVKQRAYTEAYQEYNQLRSQLLESQQDEREQAQRLSFLEFQYQELEQLALQPGEDQELLIQSKKLQHAQETHQTIQAINQLLTDQDQSVDSQLDQAVQLLSQLSTIDAVYQTLARSLESLQIDLKELAGTIALSDQEVDLDEREIDDLEMRLSQIEQMKHKYAMTVEELLDYQVKISEEIYQIKHREAYIAKVQAEFVKAYDKCYDLADQLSQIRQDQANHLQVEIEHQLQELYMSNSKFEVHFTRVNVDQAIRQVMFNREFVKLEAKGLDQVEFYVQTNLGEASKRLVKVASGGELSRLMLALKTIFSRHQAAQTLVFDEIDTGVSGRVATAIALKLAQIGQGAQVLCITHLPQVAAAADHQLLISKGIKDGRTFTQVKPLTEEERTCQIARMMSGADVSQSSLDLARELIERMQ